MGVNVSVYCSAPCRPAGERPACMNRLHSLTCPSLDPEQSRARGVGGWVGMGVERATRSISNLKDTIHPWGTSPWVCRENMQGGQPHPSALLPPPRAAAPPRGGTLEASCGSPQFLPQLQAPFQGQCPGTTHPPSSWLGLSSWHPLAVTLTSTHRCFSCEQGPQFTPYRE